MANAKTDLLQGTLDLIVLRLLRGGPANGWDITQSIQVVSKGAPVVIGNSDPVLHNVHATTAGAAQVFNRAIPVKGQTFTETFTEPGVVRLKCDVHTWMTAWLFVADTPYAAVTDKEGRFAFPSVPQGAYRLRTWHELFGEKSQPVTVPASGAAKAEVTLSLLDASN